mmetsp:Transcript_5693/g.7856  ORF Transcript_5693/g.7856 Transcript_5693/m.7856 type:complete len:258 (+) Transcript_5693:51-824(+)
MNRSKLLLQRYGNLSVLKLKGNQSKLLPYLSLVKSLNITPSCQPTPSLVLLASNRSFSSVIKHSKPGDENYLPEEYRELSNEILFVLAANGNHSACQERLVRDIMRVDGVTWEEAEIKVKEINVAAEKFNSLVRLPYQIGIAFGIGSAFSSIPLVFDLNTALSFNEYFSREDLPDGGMEELVNFWQVGSWTWGWMEPYLGTMSFVLLGFQFARAQMEKIAIAPFTERMQEMRATRLSQTFPMYSKKILHDHARSMPF